MQYTKSPTKSIILYLELLESVKYSRTKEKYLATYRLSYFIAYLYSLTNITLVL